MGKVKPRLLGIEEVEEKQKKKQKAKSAEKKMLKKKEKKTSVIADASMSLRSASWRRSNPDSTEIAASPTAPRNDINKVKKPSSKSAGKIKEIKVKSRGKKYKEAIKLVDRTKFYSVETAVSILKKMKITKFDESVELHFVVDETGLKGEVELPHSTGKVLRIAVVDDKILSDLEKGKIGFDILITHPSFMPRLAKFAKVLGPKGLMPNPKAGTISPKPEEVVKKFEKGVLRWKTEVKFPLIHQMIGKISYDDKKLIENAKKFIDSVTTNHIVKAYMKSTMSPSIKLYF